MQLHVHEFLIISLPEGLEGQSTGGSMEEGGTNTPQVNLHTPAPHHHNSVPSARMGWWGYILSFHGQSTDVLVTRPSMEFLSTDIRGQCGNVYGIVNQMGEN